MNDTEKTTTLSSEVAKAIRKQENLKLVKRVKKEVHPNTLKGLNRNGRPKGAKNKLTLLREAVLNKAETMVLEDWEEVVQTTLTMAKAGDSTALKILWDRVIPSKRAVDDSAGTKDKLNITINVQGLEVKSVMGEAVDAEFTEEDENE